MQCISCQLDAGYNRAVVDTLSGVELGGYCLRCERREFGHSLAGTQGTACTFCDRDGFYALPVWTARAVDEGHVTRSQVAYDVTETTVRVCDEHLHALREDDTPPVEHARGELDERARR